MKTLLTILLLSFSLSGFSQIKFEEGYYIDNQDNKIEGLIKNYDWKNNPTEIEFKKSEQTQVEKVSIQDIKEFGVYSYSTYIRATVKIDRSSVALNNLSAERSPVWFQEQLFLKQLVKGTACLYYYEDQNASRFFFSVQDSPIEQLIYKAYTINDTREIGYNVSFRQQILNGLACGTTSMVTINKLQYNSSDLKKYVEKYNRCMGDDFVELHQNRHNDSFDLTITSGVNFSSFNTTSTNLTKFKSQVGFKAGLDAEFILPFNKGKWRFVLNPTYQYFNDEYTETFPYGKVYTSTIEYSTIQFPIGVRHSFFLSEKTRIFASGFYVLSPQINIKNEITINTYTHVEGNKSTGNLALDFGVAFGNFKLIACYNGGRDILSNNINYNSDYHSFSVMAGLKIL